MGKKYFIVSDVHSFYDEMQKALARNDWDINNPDHIFVSLGDLLDRGPKSLECLQFVNSLPKKRKILIRGNHEDLMEECLERGYYERHDLHNGTVNTIQDVTGIQDSINNYKDQIESMKSNKEWKQYIRSCVNYAEVGNSIFVHGWIPAIPEEEREFMGKTYVTRYGYKNNWRKSKTSSWKEARWLNGMKLWSYGVDEQGKTIYCGHWHCSWGHAILHNEGVEFPLKNKAQDTVYEANFFPFYDEGIVAIDACTVISGMVNCAIIEED